MSASVEDVAAVRAFNRFYTGVIGALGEGHLGSPYTLTEARVIFELGRRDTTEVTALRKSLDLDAGYLSRMLARFEEAGLTVRERSEADRRRQVVRLTGEGRAATTMLGSRADDEVRRLLDEVSTLRRERLLSGMRTVRGALQDAPAPRAYVLRAPRPGDYGWVIQRNAVLYTEQYGWDGTYEALVAQIVSSYLADHDPARESAWIAELDGEPVGAVFCMRRDDATAQLRLLLVEPDARGLGIGGRLVEECLRFATAAGYTEIMLWTNDVLTSARRIYEAAGFALESSEDHHSFGADLTGQIWRRKL